MCLGTRVKLVRSLNIIIPCPNFLSCKHIYLGRYIYTFVFLVSKHNSFGFIKVLQELRTGSSMIKSNPNLLLFCSLSVFISIT